MVDMLMSGLDLGDMRTAEVAGNSWKPLLSHGIVWRLATVETGALV